MKRKVILMAILSVCMIIGCAGPSLKGVSKTLCEVWIYTLPQGARLYLNGNYVGRTPYKYTGINEGDSSAHFIARDLSEITVRKRGYDDEVEIITIRNCYRKLNIAHEGVNEQIKRYGGTITLYLDEKEVPVEKAYGNVIIEAVPQETDAEIYINDSLIGSGKTPLLKLQAGSYVLKVKKPGYLPYSRVISVLADNDLTIKAVLEERVESEEGEMDETGGETGDGIELSPAGEQTEIEEDTVPGVLGSDE